jgi:ATP-binding cassette, subfamily B, bacterial
MSEMFDEDEGRFRPRVLRNSQVLGYVWRKWRDQPRRFAAIVALLLIATACDLSIPWAAGALIDAVAAPERVSQAAWRAWAVLSALYLAYYMIRTGAFRVMNSFYPRIMESIVTEGFARAQAFSADWHASNFAGATVRKVSRAMWGYDSASDALLLMLGPTLLVLGGLAISIGLRWPLAGLFVAAVVGVFIVYNVLTTTHFIRPANLTSNALDTQIGGALADAIGGNAVVKSFGAEAREEARFGHVASTWRRAMTHTWNRFNLVGMGQNLLMVALQAGLTGMLLWSWSKGQASPGDVGFAITSFMLMAGYMRNFGEISRMLQKGIDDLLDVAACA